MVSEERENEEIVRFSVERVEEADDRRMMGHASVNRDWVDDDEKLECMRDRVVSASTNTIHDNVEGSGVVNTNLI